MKTTTANATHERPIPFTAESVRAILAGVKCQTRRVLKPQPIEHHGRVTYWKEAARELINESIGEAAGEFATIATRFCPYGIVGDRLWSKETWCPRANGMLAIEKIQRPFYRADGDVPRNQLPHGWKWRSGRFMPRWASRLTLEITDVRVQRVTEISEEDAEAEGIREEFLPPDPDNFHPPGSYGYVPGLDPEETIWHTRRDAFKVLWDSINGKRPGCAWKDNPWVWAISFRLPGIPPLKFSEDLHLDGRVVGELAGPVVQCGSRLLTAVGDWIKIP